MKKYILIVFILVSALFLSGCTKPSFFGSKKTAGPQIKKGSIWKSADGGSSFEPKIAIETAASENADEKKPKPQEITTADVLSITFNPNDPNIIYIGTKEDGIFKTTNGGESWKSIVFPPQKIQSFTIDRSDPDHRMFASGVWGGVGKIFRTEDGGENWKEVYSEPGQNTSVTSMSQHSIDTSVTFAGTNEGTIIKSTDSGQTWKNIGQKIEGPIVDIPFDATKKFSVYALSYGKKMYYSSNGGELWIDWEEKKKEEVRVLQEKERDLRKERRSSEAEKVQKSIEALQEKNKQGKMPVGIVSLTPSPLISGTVYAGTQKGLLYRSADYGKYWEPVNVIESTTGFPIAMVTASFSNKNEISFVAGKAFYKSLNGGVSWAVTQLDVDRPVSVISYNPKDSNILYLGLSKQAQQSNR